MVETDDKQAVTSMVLGIVAVVLCWVPLVGIVCGILAIVFYKKANQLINESPKKYGGKGMAIAGLATGIAGIFFGVLYMMYWIFIGLVVFGVFASVGAAL